VGQVIRDVELCWAEEIEAGTLAGRYNLNRGFMFRQLQLRVQAWPPPWAPQRQEGQQGQAPRSLAAPQ